MYTRRLGQGVEVVLVDVERVQPAAEPHRRRQGADEVLADDQLLQVGQLPDRGGERLLWWTRPRLK